MPDQVRGREQIISDLAKLVRQPDGYIHVLTGLGGSGKSTIALAVSRHAAAAGLRTWWVAAVDSVSATQTLLGLGRRLGAPAGEVAEAVAGRINPSDVLWPSLEATPGWLLVLDNADDVAVLAAADRRASEGAGWLRPTRAGLILVTSRTSEPLAWGPISQVHRICALNDSDGGQALLDLAPSAGNLQEAAMLSSRLGGLPLALHQAGTYLSSPFGAQRTFTGYGLALEERFGELLGRGDDDRVRVTGTWELSLAALDARGCSQARVLLQVLSCFAGATPIPSGLLDYKLLGRCGGGTVGVEDGLAGLLAMGLIEFHDDILDSSPAVVVHPLVAETTRRQARSALGRSVALATALLHAAVSNLDTEDLANRARWQALVPHLRFILTLDIVDVAESALAMLADATARTSWALSWAGYYTDAFELADSALDRMTSLDHDGASILTLMFQRAIANRHLGNFPKAESEFRRVAAVRKRTLGYEHQDTLTTEHYLAVTLIDISRLAEAELIFRQVLAKRLKALGPDNLHTLATRHWIAVVLARQGLPEQAEKESRLVYAARQQILGAEHPSTLSTLCDIGHYQADQGKITEAENTFRLVLDGQTRTMTPDHPRRLRTQYEIATVLASQGRTIEARTAYEQILEAQTRILGHGHPDTLQTLASIERLT